MGTVTSCTKHSQVLNQKVSRSLAFSGTFSPGLVHMNQLNLQLFAQCLRHHLYKSGDGQSVNHIFPSKCWSSNSEKLPPQGALPKLFCRPGYEGQRDFQETKYFSIHWFPVHTCLIIIQAPGGAPRPLSMCMHMYIHKHTLTHSLTSLPYECHITVFNF